MTNKKGINNEELKLKILDNHRLFLIYYFDVKIIELKK